MAKYIERSAAIEAAKHAWAKGLEPSQYIEALPAADVAPVVRCENCAFSQSDGWICGGTALMPQHQTFPDSFCECGVKMDGGADNG